MPVPMRKKTARIESKEYGAGLTRGEAGIIKGIVQDEHIWCTREERKITDYEVKWFDMPHHAGHALFHIYNESEMPYGGFGLKDGETITLHIERDHAAGLTITEIEGEQSQLVCSLGEHSVTNIYISDDTKSYGQIEAALMCGSWVEITLEYNGALRLRIVRATGSAAVKIGSVGPKGEREGRT